MVKLEGHMSLFELGFGFSGHASRVTPAPEVFVTSLFPWLWKTTAFYFYFLFCMGNNSFRAEIWKTTSNNYSNHSKVSALWKNFFFYFIQNKKIACMKLVQVIGMRDTSHLKYLLLNSRWIASRFENNDDSGPRWIRTPYFQASMALSPLKMHCFFLWFINDFSAF